MADSVALRRSQPVRSGRPAGRPANHGTVFTVTYLLLAPTTWRRRLLLLAATGGPGAFSIATTAPPHQRTVPTALKRGVIQLGNWTGDDGRNADLASLLA